MTDRSNLRGVEDILPPTPMQQFMLLEIAHRPESVAYFEQFTFIIRGALDLAAYRRAWETVIERHAGLRARFVWPAGERPVQVVMKTGSLPWRELDWSDGAPDLDEYLADDRREVFRPSRPPLMRIAAASLGPDSHRVIWSFHHILLDAWSVSVALSEVHQAYDALTSGREPDLPSPAPLRNAMAALAAMKPEQAEAYWRGLLTGLEGPTPLPAMRAEDESRGRASELTVISARLPETEYERIKGFAREHRVTLGSLMLAAWGLVQSRYTRQDDVVFGATFSGRSLDAPEVERIVGLLMNAAPVRVTIPRDATVGSLLEGVQRQVSQSTRHEQTLLSDVHRWAGFPPRSPTFNSIVVFGNYPLDEARAGRASPIAIEAPKSFGWTDVPLTLMVTPWRTFDVEARFDAARVDPSMVRRMLDDVMRTLCRLADNTSRNIDAIEVTDDAERRRMLMEPNRTAAPAPPATIHGLFAERLRSSPRAVAYRFGGSTLTYTGLDRRSAAIAGFLLSRGVAPGTPIAVCMEPSLDLPAAMLGVLRANCCYVPLDPTYPTARLEHMVRDSAPPIVLTTAATGGVVSGTLAEIIDVAEIESFGANLPSPCAETAYITYTSGSTGAPKGVRGTHRGAVNRFRWMWAFRPFGSREVSSWATTINFVDHVWEAFGPMLAGTPVEILSRDVVKDPRALLAALRRAKVTRMVAVPALIEAMLDAHDDIARRLPDLRICVSSGEALGWACASRFRAALPKVELINLYGSSEVAADVTYHVVSDRDLDARVIPIGRPIANTKIVLMDDRLHVTPPGVAGVIHVAGDGLAEGYHNRPDLTAERFITNPIGELGEGRLFRTGDLGRWNAQGELEFLGRADDQVKIRGFRVELGEIEHTLAAHPSVAEAAVLCRHTNGGAALHAYVVSRNGLNGAHDPSPEIRRYLRGRLPDYMVPSAIVALDRLPRTPNGKVDRKALPEPGNTMYFLPPPDPVTTRIVEIFQRVLNIPAVGADQCFFDLGGHSLLAVRLVQQLENTFGKVVPLATLLRCSTPLALRDVIEGRSSEGDASVIASLRSEGSRLAFFCIHGMDGNVLFLERLLAGLSPEQPLYGVMARGVHGDSPPLTTVEAMAEHYVDAIRKVSPNGPYVLGGYSLGGLAALEVAHRLVDAGETVARVIMIDTRVPRVAGGRSLRTALGRRLVYNLRRGPRHFLRTLYIGPIERNAYRVLAALRLPMPRRLRPWPVRFANLSAYFRYRPRPWGGAITLLRAEHQEDEYMDLPALGWEAFAKGELDVRSLPCDHMNFFGKRSAGILAAELDRILASTSEQAKAAAASGVRESSPQRARMLV